MVFRCFRTFPRAAEPRKPLKLHCKTTFCDIASFPYLVALAKLRKMQEMHVSEQKKCVKSMILEDFMHFPGRRGRVKTFETAL